MKGKEERTMMLEESNEAKQETSNVMIDNSDATLNSLNVKEERTMMLEDTSEVK